ncbi:unnamed protein product, partial [Durusdinium trenchii]
AVSDASVRRKAKAGLIKACYTVTTRPSKMDGCSLGLGADELVSGFRSPGECLAGSPRQVGNCHGFHYNIWRQTTSY